MRAIDTNVIVRFLTGDDPAQAEAARSVFEHGNIFIGVTVLLETEWVLRAGYGFAPDQVASGLTGLGGLPGVTLEDPQAIAQALDWMAAGMDFADALHLSRAEACTEFLTFDRKLAAKARKADAIPVRQL